MYVPAAWAAGLFYIKKCSGPWYSTDILNMQHTGIPWFLAQKQESCSQYSFVKDTNLH